MSTHVYRIMDAAPYSTKRYEPNKSDRFPEADFDAFRTWWGELRWTTDARKPGISLLELMIDYEARTGRTVPGDSISAKTRRWHRWLLLLTANRPAAMTRIHEGHETPHLTTLRGLGIPRRQIGLTSRPQLTRLAQTEACMRRLARDYNNAKARAIVERHHWTQNLQLSHAETRPTPLGTASPAPPEPPRAGWAGYFDGAARDNGRGVAGAGALMLVDGVKRFQFLKPLPKGTTNNVAEWEAALGLLTTLEAETVLPPTATIIGDSEMIILNMKKLRRTHKPHLQVLQKLALEAAERMRKRGCKLLYMHVPRDKNKLADKLANQAADAEQCDKGIDRSQRPRRPAVVK